MPPEGEETTSAATSGEGAAAGAASTTTAAAPETTQAPPVRTYTEEQFRAMQSAKDKAENDARLARESAERTQREATDRARQNELAGITDPTARDAVLKKWQLDDREQQLKAREQDLEADARGVAVAKMVVDYGVKPEDLEGIDDPAELRARAAELKAERLEREMADIKAGNTPESTTTPEPKKTPAAMRSAPEGSSSASGQTFDGSAFKGTGKVSDYLKAKREAGAEEYIQGANPRS